VRTAAGIGSGELSMSETTWAGLRRRLLSRYDDLTQRLGRRLGSVDLAREIIHETYLRFERVGDMAPVQNPDGYIFRTALNIAKNRFVVEGRYLTASETEMLIGVPDDAPSPEQAAGAHLEIAIVRRALAKLPKRRREIFEASWADGVPHAELAVRHGVDIRTIQREVEAATKFIRELFKENRPDGRRRSMPRLSSD
jgi:RNA polymerase sigma factor (sigma-70 family)